VNQLEVEIKALAPFVGIPTFIRAQHTKELKGVNMVIIGNPFDCGVVNRSGARFGPRAIREQSLLVYSFGNLYPWDYDLRKKFKIIDYGDINVDRFSIGSTLAMMESLEVESSKVFDAGAALLTLGGDHTTPYGSMRAAAKKYGKLSIIHIDAHQDAITTGEDHYFHGSFAWDLVKEGVIDDTTSAQIYMRTIYPPECGLGYNIFYAIEALEMGSEILAAKVRDIVGDNPVYITFDIDSLDPACAPGTGTPVFGGPSVYEVRKLLLNLKGINVIAADVVELLPQYDAHNQISAIAATTIAIDLLYLMAEKPSSS